MLIDGGTLVRRGRTWELSEGAEIDVPDSVQALIAARLDTLSPERKALLHDAAVVGKVFWSGVLAEMGSLEDRSVRDGLHELGRKELVRPAKRSSVRDEAEYAFWHALIRDVAYGQIPRPARAEKHLAAARWIEATAGERAGDVAELLAHHYEQALELSRASGATDLGELERSAGHVLVLAGERATELDPSRAERHYRRALELLPKGDPGRRTAWMRLAFAASREDQLAIGPIAEAAIAEFRGLGDRVGEGTSLAMLSRAHFWKGDQALSRSMLAQGIALMEAEPPGPELVEAYAQHTGWLMMAGRSRECIEKATKTIELAEGLDAPREGYRALGFRGVSRMNLGDTGGIDDLRAALDGFRALGLSRQTAVGLVNLGDVVWIQDGPAAGLAVHREAMAFAEKRALTALAESIRGEFTWTLYDLGRWDELIVEADHVLEWDRGRTYTGLVPEPFRTRVLLLRGQTADAEAMLDDLDRLRAAGDPQLVVPALTTAAMILAERGDGPGALALLRERVDLVDAQEGSFANSHTEAARLLAALGDLDLLERLRRQDDFALRRTQLSLATSGALLAQSRGDGERALEGHDAAGEGWRVYGNPVEAALSESGAGEALLSLERPEEASRRLRAAREVFVELDAVVYLRHVDDLLAEATAKSS